MSPVIDALYRTNLLAFAEKAMTILEPGNLLETSWHHEVIAHQLDRCRNGKTRRLIINQPPKTLKTHLVSICFPAQLLLQNPGLKIAIVCYDETLAVTIVRQLRQLLKSAWYLKLAPDTQIRDDKDTESYFETTAGGSVRAVSVAGGLTGHGFDYIVLDDPMKASLAHSETERRRLEELYSSAIANRWRNPAKGVLITVMQRLHVDDFTAFLLKIRPETTHLCIPAIAPRDMEFDLPGGKRHLFRKGELLEPERLSREFLDEMRHSQRWHFEAQYLQAPSLVGGQIIDPLWFRQFHVPSAFDYRVISIDPAFTENAGDYSAALVVNLKGDNLEIIHCEEVRLNVPDLLRWIRQLDKRWKPDAYIIEAIGAGKGLVDILKSEGMSHVGHIATHRDLSKQRRMEMVSPGIERGRVSLLAQAPWVSRFLDQLGRFPNGEYDDLADSLSQLLLHYERVYTFARKFHREKHPPEELVYNRPWMPRGLHYRQFWV